MSFIRMLWCRVLHTIVDHSCEELFCRTISAMILSLFSVESLRSNSLTLMSGCCAFMRIVSHSCFITVGAHLCLGPPTLWFRTLWKRSLSPDLCKVANRSGSLGRLHNIRCIFLPLASLYVWLNLSMSPCLPRVCNAEPAVCLTL